MEVPLEASTSGRGTADANTSATGAANGRTGRRQQGAKRAAQQQQLLLQAAQQEQQARQRRRAGGASTSTQQQEQQQNEEPQERGESGVLRDLFEGSGLHSLMDHSAIESANDPETLAVQHEASRIAQRAAEALRRSRQVGWG